MNNPERPFRVLAVIIAGLLFVSLWTFTDSTTREHAQQVASSTEQTVEEATTTAPPPTTTTVPPTTTTTEPPWRPKPCPDDGRQWQKLHRSVCYTRTAAHASHVYIVRTDWTDPLAEVNVAHTTSNGVGRKPLSAAAHERGSLVATNASYFDCNCASATNIGPLVEEGEFITNDARPQWTLLVREDFTSSVTHSDNLVKQGAKGVKLALSGSHGLVMGSSPQTSWGRSSFEWNRHPRTAFGINDQGFAFLVVVDGRSRVSAGMTLPQLADFMVSLGTGTAVNLDGGGSTEMIVNNQIVNRPSDGRERPVGSLVEVAVK